jgi:hypothetical protein
MTRIPASIGTCWLRVIALCLLMLVGGLGGQRIMPAMAGDEPSYAPPLRHLLLRQMRKDRVPGALVYVHHPTRGTWSAALGSRNLTGAPLDLASSMRIGSVTKTIVVLTNSEIAPNTPLAQAFPVDNLAKIIQQSVFRQRMPYDPGRPDRHCVTLPIEQP